MIISTHIHIQEFTESLVATTATTTTINLNKKKKKLELELEENTVLRLTRKSHKFSFFLKLKLP